MHFVALTLLPKYFQPLLSQGVVARSYQRHWSLQLLNPRDFCDRSDGRIDDRPFGGGPGMVMRYQPLAAALASLGSLLPNRQRRVLYLSPVGKPVTDEDLQRWLQMDEMVLVCGRYEGVDQRFIDDKVDEEVCVADVVMSGGELPAMCVMDALIRRLPGVLGNVQSGQYESFSEVNARRFDCPHYTRPQSFYNDQGQCLDVPEVLVSGDHKQINLWRQWQSLQLMSQRRPELMQKEDCLQLQRLQQFFSASFGL